MSLNNKKKRGGEREGRAGQKAGIFKVRFGLGEVERKDREIERHRNKVT
jgi:hypothetical protein